MQDSGKLNNVFRGGDLSKPKGGEARGSGEQRNAVCGDDTLCVDTSDEDKGLRVLQVNCRSIINKKNELQSITEASNSNVIIGTESWLTDDIY